MSDLLSPRPDDRHPLIRALLRVPTLIFVSIYFLIDDVVLAAVRPIVAWAAELRLFQRLGAWLHGLGPYPTLILFLVPFILLEPPKLWGLWLLATGHLALGGTVLAISHLTSIVLVERLFHATCDKLLTIGWFARAYGWVNGLYEWSIGRLKAMEAWQRAAAILRTAREKAREIGRRIRASAAWAAMREGVAAVRLRLVHWRIRLRGR